MKTNNTKKNSATKKLIPAVSMLTVSAMMLSTATYAWFTMSRTVKVDGMQLKTKVSGNLLISDTNASDANYGTQLTQSRTALLEPVSSVKGVTNTFWYTLDAAADGHKLHNTTAVEYQDYETNLAAGATDTENFANKFSEDYAVTKGIAGNAFAGLTGAVGYVDYEFYLKAVPDDVNNTIRLTRCNLAYAEGAINTTGTDTTILDRAWRVSVFADTTTVGSTSANPSADATKLVGGSPLGLPNASYFDGEAVTSATAKTAASINNSGVIIATGLTSGAPAYYKVTVRIWLEGEDPSCKTETYLNLNNAWKLDLQFDLVPSTDTTKPAVTGISTGAPATVNDDVPRAATNPTGS